MKTRTTVALVAAALVAGLVVGGIGIAVAEPTEEGTEGRAPGIRGMAGEFRDRLAEVVSDILGLTEEEFADARESGMSLPAIAEDQGVSTDELVDGLYEARAEELAALVAEGRITQGQADHVLGESLERIEDRVLADGIRPRQMRGDRRDAHQEVVTDLLGLTEDELREAHQSGTSLAAIASEQGVSTDELVDAMYEAEVDRLADMVAEGQVTQEQADGVLDGLRDRIEDRIMHQGTVGPRGPGGPGGMRGRSGACEAPTADGPEA
jgi:lambda repressor-like predicted transcriptional regulator